MAEVSYTVSNFLGGEVSLFAQGRFDEPAYKTRMAVCLNSFPLEQGAWTRRPGTRHAQPTRGGAAARLLQFDFKQATPYTLELSDGTMRFRSGAALVMTNDSQAIVSISAANPAKVKTGVHGWTGTITVMFDSLGVNNPLLQNRQFTGTVTSTTELTLADAITGATIDGSTLGTFVSGNVKRVMEVTTPYISDAWTTVRAVQAETADFLFHPSFKPQSLTTSGTPATFALAAANFKDGPYLDPFTNGALATPNGKTGNINITISFNAYDATKSYSIGDFVTSSSVNYQSLTDGNIANTPVSSPSNWVAVNAQQAIVNPNGMVGVQATDVGRLIRLLSEPADWAVGTAYTTGNIVKYNPTGQPGASTYWVALASTTGNIPGSDTTHWAISSNAFIWTWGKITSLLTMIDRALASSVNIGTMTTNGGLAAAFDGLTVQPASNCAALTTSGPSSLTSYIGKDYHSASAQKIAWATIYPSINLGLMYARFKSGTATFTINLRAKASAPANSADGTLLGTYTTTSTIVNAVTINSNDTSTSWNYVWFELITTISGPAPYPDISHYCAEAQFFNPPGTGSTGNGIAVQLLGPPLLYTTPIQTWRLGLYSDTTGWPSVGGWMEGRLWLSGAVPNRIDSCVSNGVLPISPGTVNFAPTDQNGTVSDANAISYTFSATDVNAIFWMAADQRGLICGTQAGEWLVFASDQNNKITPTNIQARRVTKNGCANIEPRRTGLTLVFVQRYARKLMEYFADVFSGKFTAPNLAAFFKHLTQAGIAELAYQQELTPIVWMRCGDGSLNGMTYKREILYSSQGPTFNGAHRHTLGSGRTVESIVAGPSVGGTLDTLTMVTNEVATGIRHVEVLTDIFDEGSALTAAWFLDDAVAPSSYSVSGLTLTLNGLWHLNGKTVSVFAGGSDRGDVTVANGSATLTLDAANGNFTAAYVNSFSGAMPIVVGFTYNSDGQVLRPVLPADAGSRTGPALGKKRRQHQAAILLKDTCPVAGSGSAFNLGTDFAHLAGLQFQSDGGNALAAFTMFSGIYRETVNDDYSFDGALAWRISRPVPATVVAIEAMGAGEN